MAETITTTTEEKVLPGKFQQYFQTFLNILKGEAGFKDRSAAELKYDVTNALRPAYEKARASRISQTGRNAAMIDTDAVSRGMGSSTWVTDAKNRLRTQEAADLAGIDSDYASALYNALLNRMDNQDNKRMSLLNTALSTTQGMYDKWLSEDTAATSGGSSGGGSGSSRRRSSGSRSPNNGLTDPGFNPDTTTWVSVDSTANDGVTNKQTIDSWKESAAYESKERERLKALEELRKKNQRTTSQGGAATRTNQKK